MNPRPISFVVAVVLFGLAPFLSFVPEFIAGNAQGVFFAFPIYFLFWSVVLSGLYRGYASSLFLIGLYTLWQLVGLFDEYNRSHVLRFAFQIIACVDLIGAFVLCFSGECRVWFRGAIELNHRKKVARQSRR
ncbi:MAG: hypothetical protein QOE70_4555 [Chthoniobacter sp.]|jgi:hypothetical protein|nr:hypothetical protein [Chthoniobacter sp.]